MSVKVLFDTDIGSDIDDAICLAYLLANPECELLGITTVTGEGEKRAKMASVLCKLAGKDIPILPGAEDPLIVPPLQAKCHHWKAWEERDCETSFPKGQAVEFMRQTIRKNPGEVVLLPVGPLTNIALLFSADPQIPSLLKGIYWMGGLYFRRFADRPLAVWNPKLDPHAAAIVYKHPVAVHRSIGFDVTREVTMAQPEVRERFRVPLLEPILECAKLWFDFRPEIIFHDPLAAVTIFDEKVCQFERGNVEMELVSESLRGTTIWTPDPDNGRHEAATSVDRSRFFDAFFGVFH